MHHGPWAAYTATPYNWKPWKCSHLPLLWNTIRVTLGSTSCKLQARSGFLNDVDIAVNVDCAEQLLCLTCFDPQITHIGLKFYFPLANSCINQVNTTCTYSDFRLLKEWNSYRHKCVYDPALSFKNFYFYAWIDFTAFYKSKKNKYLFTSESHILSITRKH